MRNNFSRGHRENNFLTKLNSSAFCWDIFARLMAMIVKFNLVEKYF